LRLKAFFTLALLLTTSAAFALDVPPLPDLASKSAGGLVLTVESVATKATDVRHARMAALYVPEGSAITPFLPPGPFKATWTGELSSQIRSEYVFLAEGNGKLTVKIGEEVALEASGNDFAAAKGKVVKLMKGKNKLTVLYESPEKGDAFLKLFWQSGENPPDFMKEPLPIQRLTHDISIKEVRTGMRLREGRELFGELRCSRCHTADGIPAPGSIKAGEATLTAMPELEMDAPDLSEAGARLKSAWVTQWLKDPRKLRPESSMPQVLHGDTAPKDALDIAAYLATLGKAEEKPADAADEKLIQQGGGIVERLGCVGCHTMPDNPKVEAGRVPLRYVRAKWHESALKAFLKQPDKHYKWVRMPNFNFSDDDINKVTAFLLHSKVDAAAGWLIEDVKDKGDAARGKTLAQSAGCVNCHNLGAGVASSVKTPPLTLGAALSDSWTKGCVAPDAAARAKAPDFHLTAHQRGALLAFAANTEAKKSLNTETMPEYAERQIRVLRCVACHQRDDQDDFWSRLEDETAALKFEEAHEPADAAENAEPHIVAQIRPKLTWIGEKLKPEWMTDFIGGKTPYKVRTWLGAKMPGFPQRAGLIARGLVIEHGFKPVSPPEPEPDAAMLEVGRKLVSKNGGFSCTSCHSVGKAAAVGVFEAPGPNLMHAKARLTKSYFHRWMREPLRVEPDTKMPAFAQGDKTQLPDYDGDAVKQFEAIWQYFLTGEKIEPPEE